MFILIPSIIELFSKVYFKTDSDNDNNYYEIIVVHKESNHSASINQWNTVTSTVNYFTHNGLNNDNQFDYLGRKFKLSKFYESEHREIICSGIDPTNKLKNVIAILGPITSTCAREMINEYKKEIPVISSFATLPLLNQDARKFFHRTVPDDNFRVEKLVQLWKHDATINLKNMDLIIYYSSNI
jgi:hypothetical protein